MNDIFTIDFEAKITKCILEKNEIENIIVLDVSFYDISGLDNELVEDIDFEKYYFLNTKLDSTKNVIYPTNNHRSKNKDIVSEKIEFEVIDNKQVKVIKKQFLKKFTEDYAELQYSFGLDVDKIKLDFPFLKDQLSNSEKITKKNIIILENDIAKEFVQDFRNLSYQKSVTNVKQKYSETFVDTLFEKKIDLSEKTGRKNSLISQIFTTYGNEKKFEKIVNNVYLYFYIDSEQFIDNFCKYPKIIENPSADLLNSLSISATINESTETKLCEPLKIGFGSKYVYYRVKFESEHIIDKKIILKFFGIDFSVTKAKSVFTNLSQIILNLKNEKFSEAKHYLELVPYILNDNKKQINKIISSKQPESIKRLIENLQKIYSNYSSVMEGSGQSEDVSATSQPTYSSNNIISFNKEVEVKKEKKTIITIGESVGVFDGILSFQNLKIELDKRMKSYYDISLTQVEASKEKSIPLLNTKYSYLNFDTENLDKFFNIFGESPKEASKILFSLINDKKLENDLQFKDVLLSHNILLQEELKAIIGNFPTTSFSTDLIFGTAKEKETRKTTTGEFDDTLDYSKMIKTLKSLYIIGLLEDINKRDCELEYYNLKVDTLVDLKFALLDFLTSLVGDSYLNKLPNSTKCLFGMFGKDNQKIIKDSKIFIDNTISFDKFFDFFLKYQFVFEIKYLQAGSTANNSKWERLTLERVNTLLNDEKLLCKLEVFEDDNIVSTKLLSKLKYSLRDEYFMLGK